MFKINHSIRIILLIQGKLSSYFYATISGFTAGIRQGGRFARMSGKPSANQAKRVKSGLENPLRSSTPRKKLTS